MLIAVNDVRVKSAIRSSCLDPRATVTRLRFTTSGIFFRRLDVTLMVTAVATLKHIFFNIPPDLIYLLCIFVLSRECKGKIKCCFFIREILRGRLYVTPKCFTNPRIHPNNSLSNTRGEKHVFDVMWKSFCTRYCTSICADQFYPIFFIMFATHFLCTISNCR